MQRWLVLVHETVPGFVVLDSVQTETPEDAATQFGSRLGSHRMTDTERLSVLLPKGWGFYLLMCSPGLEAHLITKVMMGDFRNFVPRILRDDRYCFYLVEVP